MKKLVFLSVAFLATQTCLCMEKNPPKLNNCHKVDEKLLRSGLSDPEELKKAIKNYNIKDIYAFTRKNEEVIKKVAEDISWRFLSLSSHEKPSVDDFKILVDFAKKIASRETRTLCYDKDGKNRTGTFSALYLIVALHKNIKEALEQFSYWKYGYIGIWHRFASSGGISFIEKFEESYRIFKKFVTEKKWDATDLSNDQKVELFEQLKPEGLGEYFDYALAAVIADQSES